ncbi:hypothetical protein FOZ63_010618, partial [Perkinsus olseni]
MLPKIAHVASKLAKEIKALSRDREGRILCKPEEWIPRCSLDILCVTTFGIDFNFLGGDGEAVNGKSKDVQNTINGYLEGVSLGLERAAFPLSTRNIFPFNLDPAVKNYHKYAKLLHEHCGDIIRARKEDRKLAKSGEKPDLLDKMLALPENDLIGNLSTFLIAGSDTASVTVSWALYYFCLYPDAQRRARAEVDSLEGIISTTKEDTERLPFLQCCVLETLRLQPPFGVMALSNTEATSVADVEFPARTSFLLLLRKAMSQPVHGGTYFRPELWFGDDGKTVDASR